MNVSEHSSIARVAEQLKSEWGEERVLREEPMSRHTTFQAGGPAAVFAEPATEEALAAGIAMCRREEVPCFVLGRGSNLLVGDLGYPGVIFHIGEDFAGMSVEGERIEAGAGVLLSALARFARLHGLSGLEFAGGIPGTLGGALFMNAGAYGGEMKDVVTEVRVLLPDGTFRWLPAGELDLAYRSSRLQKEGMIALAARMTLKPGDPEVIQETMNDLAQKRRSKQPLEHPSAGSTFKRPEGYFAGKLIQDAGLAGYRVGGACVSPKHCGFVVNDQGGTAADILAVCRDVQAKVQEQFGVTLEMEIRCLGDFT